MTTATETREEQRARILAAHPEVDPFTFDSLVALGYEPESWDGFYRVPAIAHPVAWMSPTSALVAEVIRMPDGRTAHNRLRYHARTHWVTRHGQRPPVTA